MYKLQQTTRWLNFIKVIFVCSNWNIFFLLKWNYRFNLISSTLRNIIVIKWFKQNMYMICVENSYTKKIWKNIDFFRFIFRAEVRSIYPLHNHGNKIPHLNIFSSLPYLSKLSFCNLRLPFGLCSQSTWDSERMTCVGKYFCILSKRLISPYVHPNIVSVYLIYLL